MIALDTNVIVRVVANDDPAQVARAKRLVNDNVVLVTSTVLLECEWVLRSTYGKERDAIAKSLQGFLGLPNVRLNEAEAVSRALDLYSSGFDFGDALHMLLAARDASVFATFDAGLRRRAARAVNDIEIRVP